MYYIYMCLICKRSFFRPCFYMYFLLLRSYTNSFKTDLFLVLLVKQKRFNYYFYKAKRHVKGIDRPFGGRVESILIRSVMVNWRLGYFFLSHFKGPLSKDQQKTIRRRLITFKVTLTGQSHFKLIFVLREVTLLNRINSVP
jgi:hypothetical protein